MAFDLSGTLSKLAGRDTADDTVDDTTGTMSEIARRQIMARINSLKAERSGGDNFSAFAAGLLQPTKTGSFGESLGYGLAELNKSDAASKTARDAREDLMLKYQLALADDEATASTAAAAAQVKAAAAPRAPTAADKANYPGITDWSNIQVVGGKLERVTAPPAVPKEEGPTQAKLVGAILQKIINKERITPEEQKVLDFVTASETPTGFVKTPTGLQVVPGFVEGQGRLADARRPPPKAPPPQPDNPAILLQQGKL
jgi:hypothetical protein